MQPFILASGSPIRTQLLQQARLAHEAVPARLDEETIKQSLLAEAAPPRDIADTLAEMKALKISEKRPEALVLGSDQVLDLKGELLSKPGDRAEARAQLVGLRGTQHSLFSAAVICEAGKPLWRHVGQVRLRMRPLSDAYIHEYVDRNWDSIRDTVGCYKLEQEGVRLFSRIEGDYFTVLGLPLLDLLSYLALRGEVKT